MLYLIMKFVSAYDGSLYLSYHVSFEYERREVMPGALFHLAFVEEIYRLSNLDWDKLTFMAGNLIPDMAKNKMLSHYRISACIKGFMVPNLDAAGKDLLVFDDALKMGMFCHLYLDHYFIKNYLIPSFMWDIDNMVICNPRNDRIWSIEDFFSCQGMYGAYSEINWLILKNGLISMDTINRIPEVLPRSGIPFFDDRHEKSWKRQLDEHLSDKRDYTGEIFDYEHLWYIIRLIASRYVREVLQQKGY